MRFFRKGFTLFEILAVLFLIAIGFAVAFGVFSGQKASLKKASQMLTQDLQTLYTKSIERSKVYRVTFPIGDKTKYVIEEYQTPMVKPKEENREAFEKWQEHQREIEALSADERKRRTRLDRGSFKKVKERELPGRVEIDKFVSSRAMEEKADPSLFLFPTGEIDRALIILRSDELKYSLTTNPLNGRVTLIQNEVTEQEWKKDSESQ